MLLSRSGMSCQKAVEALAAKATLPSRVVSRTVDLAVCEPGKRQALPPDLSYRQSVFAGGLGWCAAAVQWSRLIAHFFLNI